MAYKTTLVVTNNKSGKVSTIIDYDVNKAAVISDLIATTERYNMENRCVHYLNGSIGINLSCNLLTVIGYSEPLKDSLSSMDKLKEGDCWRGINEPEGTFRIVQQVGKTEVYSPEQNENTMGHSMSGGESVYQRSSNVIILYIKK